MPGNKPSLSLAAKSKDQFILVKDIDITDPESLIKI